MPAQKEVVEDNYFKYPELAGSIIISQMISGDNLFLRQDDSSWDNMGHMGHA